MFIPLHSDLLLAFLQQKKSHVPALISVFIRSEIKPPNVAACLYAAKSDISI